MRRRYVVLRKTRPDRAIEEKVRETALKLFGICSLAPSLKKVRVQGVKEEFVVFQTINKAVRQVVTACTLTSLDDEGTLRVVGVTGTLAKAKELLKRLTEREQQ